MRTTDIAIIGLGCRFPGGVSSPDEFWSLLSEGRDAVTEVPADRWDQGAFLSGNAQEAGRSYTFRAGTLGDVSGFDPAFFGISPREAEQMDPQQRLLLEMAWEALERGGQVPERLAGQPVAVYVGISGTDYADSRQGDPSAGNAYFMLGSVLSIAANRLSYVLDLTGPSMAVDTACSSSMVALHEACQAIWSGRVPMALVGGMNLLLSPYPFIGFSKASMLSTYGQCRAFDSIAKGYVRAEGGAVLALKPLADAERDGDPIHAVIKGAGINSDGRTQGIALPSAEGQEALMRRVYEQFGIDPTDLSYFEAHGTGTAVGDPIETQAIGRAIGQRRAPSAPLPIGSVKTNIGHMEPASGMGGLVKALLVLKNRAIPPSLHLDEPNPEIDFAGLNLKPVTSLTPLADSATPAMVGVNSFGFGGANAHVVLAEYRTPAAPTARVVTPAGAAEPAPLVLSARCRPALEDLAGRMAAHLASGKAGALDDVLWTAATRRQHHENRLVARFSGAAALSEALQAVADGQAPQGVHTGSVVERHAKVAFLFSGNGSQWAGMGKALMAEDPVFRAMLERIDTLIRAEVGWSVMAEIAAPVEDSRLDDTRIAQPMLFAVQAAMVDALKARGVRAEGVVGHSVGEVAAAYAAGILSLEQAVHVIVRRSTAQGKTKGHGRMAACDLTADQAAAEVAPFEGLVEIAAYNSPKAVTLSGDEDALKAIGDYLGGEGIAFRLLDLDYAFHNRVLDPVKDDLLADLADLTPQSATMAYYSTVSGGCLDGAALDATYWWDNVRQPVKFHQAVAAMAEDGFTVFIEIGPHPIMQAYVRQTLRAVDKPGQPVSVMNRRSSGLERLLKGIDEAFTLGADLDWDCLFAAPGPCIDLPTYPFQRESFWFKPSPEATGPVFRHREAPMLGVRPLRDLPVWETVMDLSHHPFLTDHVVGEGVVFPAAGFLEMALEASALLFGEARVDIEQMDIRRPLVLDPARAKMVRFVWNPEDGIFHIESRTRMHDEPWSQHVTGRLAKPAGVPPEEYVPVGALAQAAGAARLYDAESHYAFADSIGLNYGPAFRAVQQVQVSGDEALADLALPDGLDPDTFALHPSLFDGCLQALFDILRERTGADDGAAYLPAQIGRFKLHGRGSDVAHCHIRLTRAGPRSLVADFLLADRDGVLLAEARNFRFQRVELGRRGHAATPYHAFQIVPLPPLGTAPALAAPATVADAVAAIALPTGKDADLDVLAAAFAAAAVHEDRAAGSDSAPLLAHLWQTAGAAGYARQDADGVWRLTGNAPDAEDLWRATFAARPDRLAELVLLGRAGRHLGAVLDGADTAMLYPGSAVMEQFHNASPGIGAPCNDGLVAAVESIIANRPAHRRLRILEVGAGSGGLSRRLLATLPKDGFALTVTDASDEALAHLEAELHHPDVVVSRLDLLSPVDGQDGIVRHGYDIVVGAHLLASCAAASMALETVNDLLTPGGLLVLGEVAPAPWLDLAFGVVDPLWDLAADSASGHVRDRAGWTQALTAAGLAEAQAVTTAGAIVLIATRRAQADRVVVPDGSRFAILVDADPAEASLAEALAGQLGLVGADILLLHPGTEYARDGGVACLDITSADDWTALWTDLAAEGTMPGCVVHLLGAGQDAGADPLALQDRRVWTTLALVQGLGRTTLAVPPRLTLVTSGAVAVDGDASSPAQAPLWGAGRVLANEHPNLGVRLIDLHPGKSRLEALAEGLAMELVAAGEEDEVVLKAQGSEVARLGLRLRPIRLSDDVQGTVQPAEATPALAFTPGSLDALRWSSRARRAPEEGEVELRVEAAGLNFRDVMFAMGILPDEALENGFSGATVGMEAAGVIERVGPGVSGLKPGDEVVCFAPACFSGHVTTRTTAVAPMPRGLDFAAGATIPTVFFTVYYALSYLARLEPGERILIHGAAGGVGIAAVQYARSVGAEIFATAGSPEKRDVVRLLGVPDDHVLDSRSVAFEQQIRDLTNGEGIDVVLNSLAGEAIHKSLSLLRPFGRFLELGKRDFYANSRLGLRPFRNNISYYGIDADQLMVERPALAARLFAEMTALFEKGVFSPLPYRVFEGNRVIEAFRHMQQARHIGKIVLAIPPLPEPAAVVTPTPYACDPEGIYLVTGGLGGFGLEAARWLVTKGATRLVLVSRSGPVTEEARAGIAALEALGATVTGIACDVSDRAAVTALIADIGPGLRGVVHAAAVFDDGIADTMTNDQLMRVLAPKVAGGWALHKATAKLPLDLFLCFSSVTTMLGNPGQANYVAANIFLEALCARRRAKGLAGLAVCWGAIADAGYLTRNADVGQSLEKKTGATALTTAQAFAHLDRLLATGASETIVSELDWKVLRAGLAALRSPRFAEVAGRGGVSENEDGVSFLDLIADLSPSEVRQLLIEMLAEQVGHVLRLPPDKLDLTKSIFDMGMDSLMALELRMMIEERFGVELPAMAITEGATITRLAERIRDFVIGDEAPSEETVESDAVSRVLASHAEALDDVGLAALIADVQTEGNGRIMEQKES